MMAPAPSNPADRAVAELSSPEEFRAYLRMVIKRAGLSYRQLAEASGELPARSGWVEIKPATLSEILNKRLPTRAQLRTILTVCRVRNEDARLLLECWDDLQARPPAPPAHALQSHRASHDEQADLVRLASAQASPPQAIRPAASTAVRDHRREVRELIVPAELIGAYAELAELTGFCEGDEAYAWWQGEPWAGKTALTSWFVLRHPPPGY